jgi:soluble lytic murein transglycosylase-like protein
MNIERLFLPACLMLAAALAGVAGCDPKESSDGKSASGFDSSAAGNRPEPARFGQRQEAVLSPEAKSMLEKAQGTTAGAGASSDPTADAGRWGKFFDGTAEKGPLDESKVSAVMAREGASRSVVNTVLSESRQQGADPLLVFSVIKQESGFDPRQRSPVGARGLMQIMPDTGRGLGVRNPSQLYDPEVNVKAGVRYLKDMFEKFSNVAMTQISTIDPFADNGVKSAIAAYNAGPGNVSKHGGVPPFSETREYVRKVLGYYADYRRQVASSS